MIVGLIQPLVGEQKEENLNQILVQIESAVVEGQANLVILPELWNTPFINEKILEHQDEWSFMMDALCQRAKELGVWIVAGSLPCKKNGHLYNACAIIDANGKIAATPSKTHLLEVHTSKHTYRERDVFTPGDSLCKIKTPWGYLGVLICYDNRFCENYRLIAKDCFLIAAVCGFNEQVGKKHWKPLFQTRAMENQVFICAVNPAQADYGSYTSYGHSMVVSPDGQVMAELGSEPGNLIVNIDPQQVEKIRFRSPLWKIRRLDLTIETVETD
ncbi:nitrilase-related carbon-nitrogen hydrolase [Allobaculum sp. JKK-2023]|uniref:nitrilase-related carbon-nitrogen hydrolase n=1 Tax=Allobaculum sp. JKK-2023 TaxID=3108943 RepID=UPI002B059DD0|nr:nitrilase-related carbon-nitrogen hydrolase [Allobaculum sp. JKK-2023]